MSSHNLPSADVLDDAARSGSKRAGDALSTLLGKNISVDHVEARYVPSANGAILMSLEVQHDQAAVGRLSIAGDIEGAAFVVMSQKSIDEMRSTFGIDADADKDMSDSLLREVSNITASSYINALADVWTLDLSPSPVELTFPADGVSTDLSDAAKQEWPAVVFRCAFLSDSRTYDLSLVLLLDSEDREMAATGSN